MRILILGGDGMLGHRLLQQLAPRHEARVTLRQPLAAYRDLRRFDPGNAYDGIDARDPAAIERVVAAFAPEAVVNSIGIVKQRREAAWDTLAMQVNAIFPHLLSRVCRRHGARLIQMSTDCVFSGKKGNYSEQDRPDHGDVYGLSKLLGEADGPHVVTLRTSMIGPELRRKTGLVEWFLAQHAQGKPVTGWRKAIFSGFTTAELSRLIETLLTLHPGAAGLYHVSSAAISKHDLLSALNDRLHPGDRLRPGIRIEPSDEPVCDRSLDSSRFRKALGYAPPAWDAMLDELARDLQPVKAPG